MADARALSEPVVEQILEELEPIIAHQRRAVARAGCLRAISSTHLHVLFLLVSDGPQPMSRLAEQLDVSLPNATGIVDRMVGRGLVVRSRDGADRRLVVVDTTDAGRAAVEEIDLVRRRQLARVLAMLSERDKQRALDVFHAMRLAAEQVDGESPAG